MKGINRPIKPTYPDWFINANPNSFIDFRELRQIIGDIPKSTMDYWVKEGYFPRPEQYLKVTINQRKGIVKCVWKKSTVLKAIKELEDQSVN